MARFNARRQMNQKHTCVRACFIVQASDEEKKRGHDETRGDVTHTAVT